MLSLKNIASYYPLKLQSFPRYMLREYLQCKILQTIFNSPLAVKLSFIGGTALRVVHENARFSEDLDFDNFGISRTDFDGLSSRVKKELELEGVEAEIKNVFIKSPIQIYSKPAFNLIKNYILKIKENLDSGRYIKSVY